MSTASDLLVPIVVGAGTMLAAVIDVRTRRVPNVVTVSLAAAGLSIAAAGLGRVGPGMAVAGGAVALALMLPGYLLGATGAGDVKLFGASGALLGPWLAVEAFVCTAVVGGLIALVIAARRRRLRETLEGTAWLVASGGAQAAHVERPDANNRFAYAPAIAIGVVLVAVAGPLYGS
ncbi:MAG: prepilin peptidase [Acidobacteria bacterium]|nr:prepilin peptidase [Acidobacteriota bacterium]